jgi:hypothetical protein
MYESMDYGSHLSTRQTTSTSVVLHARRRARERARELNVADAVEKADGASNEKEQRNNRASQEHE